MAQFLPLALRIGFTVELNQLFAQSLEGREDSEEAWAAIHRLRTAGTREVFDRAAVWCLSDDDLKRARGADIIGQLGKTVAQPHNAFPVDSFRVICGLLTREAKPSVIASAIHALGHLECPEAIPVICSFAEHRVSEVRFAVACALGSFANDASSIDTLTTLMKDEDASVRDWATTGLGVFGDADSPAIRQSLRAAFEDHNDDVWEEAMVGLAKRKDLIILPRLLEALENSVGSFRQLEAAQTLLGESGKKRNPQQYGQDLRCKFPA